MSGTNSSQRQWTTGHVRVLAAVLLALSMLISTGLVALAQDGIGARASQFGVLCIKGTVIDHDELPLEGFDVTATSPDGATVLTDVSDEHGYFEFLDLPQQGVWTVAVTLKEAYTPVAPYLQTLSINVDYGKSECVQIRFKLQQLVPVIVTKIDELHNLLDNWLITAAPAKDNWFAYAKTEKTGDTDPDKQFATGTVVFDLTTGNWIFSEQPPAITKDNPDPTHFRPIVPNTGKQTLKVECVLDQTGNACLPVEIRFKNLIKDACIDAFKFDSFVTDGITTTTGLSNWKITVKRIDDSVVASGVTDAMGKVTFSPLHPGKYKVVEEMQPGWVVDPSSPENQTIYIVDVVNGEDCAQVQFTNIQQNQFCIDGRKFDTFGGIGLPGWEITAYPLKKGGYPTPGVDPDVPDANDPTNTDLGTFSGKIVTLTDDQGNFKFTFPENDYRIPGAGYKVCEETQDGWLAHTPLCQTVYLPKHPGACVKAKGFENQQVGHWESVTQQRPYGSSSGAGCSTTYTVQHGDSLYGIGAMYGVSPSAMLASNPWVYSRPNYYVYAGDSVCIP